MPEHTFRIVSTEDGIKTDPCNQSELIEPVRYWKGAAT